MKKIYTRPAIKVVSLRKRPFILIGSTKGPTATSVHAPGLKSTGNSAGYNSTIDLDDEDID